MVSIKPGTRHSTSSALGNTAATVPVTVPVRRVLEECRGQRTTEPLALRPVSGKPVDRRDVYGS